MSAAVTLEIVTGPLRPPTHNNAQTKPRVTFNQAVLVLVWRVGKVLGSITIGFLAPVRREVVSKSTQLPSSRL